ncbi:hypothetical protein BGX38DRAFT_1333611 [Terfezia claveryi]|nr:hypothetical protein BGX38DRAFT_1333611 [Terfezia claveryi]
MAMDNSNSFNALTQAHPGRSAADYRTVQTLLTTEVTSIPKKPYVKATLLRKFLGLIQSKPIANSEYKTKSVANGDDLKSMIRFLWMEAPIVYAANRYRVQLALFLLLASFTASRPGAIVESSNHRSSNESLEYGETKLLLEEDEETGTLGWVLLVYFHKRKNRRGNEEACFRLRDIGEDPFTWPVTLMIALA